MTSQGQMPGSPFRSNAAAPTGTVNSLGLPRVAIVHKHPLVRQGLKALMVRDERFRFVADAASGGALLRLLEEEPIDVAIVGWSLPDMTGGDVLCDLKRQCSPVRVVIYTDAKLLEQAVKFGAHGFVSTTNEPSDVLDAIVAVARGRVSFPQCHMLSLSRSPIGQFTARECELMAQLAKGLTNPQIAAHCGISRNTVKYHLKNIYDKLNVTSRAMAIALFMSLPRV